MNEELLKDAIANPRNLGEMSDADAVGTMGSADCGDMVRMWIKFKEKDGRKVIDRASFQSFGCQTAIAVASLATELLKGKTVDEARNLSAQDLAEPLGPLPPMKIHCGQMVEGALRAALSGEPAPVVPTSATNSATLLENISTAAPKGGKIRVIKLDSPHSPP